MTQHTSFLNLKRTNQYKNFDYVAEGIQKLA